jgi:pimeloyl-ACP methyl ester carboxylesterase
MLHGLGANARWWEMVAGELVSEGLFSLAPDLRGHGLTDKPDGDYGFATFRRDLLAFIDAFPLERPLLAGHAWGARLALDYAANFPVGPRAPGGLFLVDEGLGQLDGDPGSSGEQPGGILHPPQADGLSQEEYLALLAEALRPWGLDERVTQILLADFEVVEDETLRPRLSRERRSQLESALGAFKPDEMLARVRCPIKLVRAGLSGEARRVQLESSVNQAQILIPGLQAQRMPGARTLTPLQYPAALARQIAGFAREIP